MPEPDPTTEDRPATPPQPSAARAAVPSPRYARAGLVLVTWITGTALALVMWWPLMRGHGLVGGDIYTYYFPLKAWYADRLRDGELAFWNPLIGNGAPVLGESQTGVFYPFNLVLYRLLPLNTAYNASFIFHYILAFGFTGLYLQRLGLRLGSLLGAVVFVYGWFPPRSCLEWAIVTGAWTPLVLWGVEGYLQDRRRSGLVAATLALAVQLLAGHYNLAFITLLIVGIYSPLRWLTLHTRRTEPARPGNSEGDPAAQHGLRRFAGQMGAVAASAGLAVGLAAIQLAPTWELKSRSQRATESFRSHDVAYGGIPAWYLAQIVRPWSYYPDVKAGRLDERFGAAYTNRIEAHLYFGMLPLLLGAVGIVNFPGDERLRVWLLLAALGLAMVTGWWTEALGWLPGFGYFAGPGRYGIVAQLGVAVAASFGLEAIVRSLALKLWPKLAMTALAITICWIDFDWAAECVQYAQPIQRPPVAAREQSVIRQLLRPTDRVLSVNQNSVTLCDAAMLPVYLGIGPAEYYQAPTRLPEAFQWNTPMTEPVHAWLRQAGVTHILSLEPHPDWPCAWTWQGFDPMLSPMLGHLWLYRLNGALGRAYWVPREASQLDPMVENASLAEATPISGVGVRANRVEIHVELPVAATVVLTDLHFPGWRVWVDDREAPGDRYGDMYRAVRVPAGRHKVTWEYFPRSLALGSVLSLATAVLSALAAFRMRRT